MKPKHSPTLVAFHEAGHAAMALRTGRRFEKVVATTTEGHVDGLEP